MRNSLDAVSDRDFILDILNLCSLIFIHLSRLSEEIILWSLAGFNFIALLDENIFYRILYNASKKESRCGRIN